MAGNSLSDDIFDRQPIEVSNGILRHSSDLSCLWNVFQASPALSAVFNSYSMEILDAVLRPSVHPGIVPVMHGVLWSRMTGFPLSLHTSRRIGSADSWPIQPWGGAAGAETAKVVRSFLATVDKINKWSHVCLNRLIGKSLELRPLTLAGRLPWPDTQIDLRTYFQLAPAENQPHQPLITGPPSP